MNVCMDDYVRVQTKVLHAIDAVLFAHAQTDGMSNRGGKKDKKKPVEIEPLKKDHVYNKAELVKVRLGIDIYAREYG